MFRWRDMPHARCCFDEMNKIMNTPPPRQMPRAERRLRRRHAAMLPLVTPLLLLCRVTFADDAPATRYYAATH